MDEGTVTNKYEIGKLYHIDVDKLHPDPNQPRKYFNPEAQKQLEESIRDAGLLSPVCFRLDGDDLILVAGERRLRAAKEIGLEKISAILIPEGASASQLSLIENLNREDLTPVEKAEALNRYKKEKNLSNRDLSREVHKSDATISEILTLMKLPPDIRAIARESSKWSIRRLLQIAKQPNEEKRRKLFDLAKEQDLTGDELKSITRKRIVERTKASFTIAALGTFRSHYSKIDMPSIDQAEKDTLRQGMEKLRDFIEEKLQDDFGVPKH